MLIAPPARPSPSCDCKHRRDDKQTRKSIKLSLVTDSLGNWFGRQSCAHSVSNLSANCLLWERKELFFFPSCKIWKTNVGGVKRINTLRSQHRAQWVVLRLGFCLFAHRQNNVGREKIKIKKTIKPHNQESLGKISRTCIFAQRQNSKQFAPNEMFNIETNCQSACIYCYIKTIQKDKTLNVSFIGVYSMKILSGYWVNISWYILKVKKSDFIIYYYYLVEQTKQTKIDRQSNRHQIHLDAPEILQVLDLLVGGNSKTSHFFFVQLVHVLQWCMWFQGQNVLKMNDWPPNFETVLSFKVSRIQIGSCILFLL